MNEQSNSVLDELIRCIEKQQPLTMEQMLIKVLDKQNKEIRKSLENEKYRTQMICKKLAEMIQDIAEKNCALNDQLHRKESIIQQQKKAIEQLGKEYVDRVR
ncbi:hypothetical protein [Priestia taiwanensis]|uniref:Uncharacterized protein n=1 Tax=Priestia taiwanensis TaxID=1347902 RepID=A0A917ENW0_9BACI|nr:hypothetical protein [Priestia taiwanensis]MBM7362710.1 hypothetical protein [Priestia taiwanensis]GGE64450.1 hypothetical protein GCM10007140_13330 [Priestia taiwanensis]